MEYVLNVTSVNRVQMLSKFLPRGDRVLTKQARGDFKAIYQKHDREEGNWFLTPSQPFGYQYQGETLHLINKSKSVHGSRHFFVWRGCGENEVE